MTVTTGAAAEQGTGLVPFSEQIGVLRLGSTAAHSGERPPQRPQPLGGWVQLGC